MARSLYSISSRTRSRNLRNDLGAATHYEDILQQHTNKTVSTRDDILNRHVLESRMWQMMARGLYDPNAARYLSPVREGHGSFASIPDAILTSPVIRIGREDHNTGPDVETDLILSPVIMRISPIECPLMDALEERTEPLAPAQTVPRNDSDSSSVLGLLSSPIFGSIFEFEHNKDNKPTQLMPEAPCLDLEDAFLLERPSLGDGDVILHTRAGIQVMAEEELLEFPEDVL
jgi:hypothetical protein